MTAGSPRPTADVVRRTLAKQLLHIRHTFLIKHQFVLDSRQLLNLFHRRIHRRACFPRRKVLSQLQYRKQTSELFVLDSCTHTAMVQINR